MTTTSSDDPDFSLTYLESFKIGDEDEGIEEPSGLALSHDRKALWTVSDNQKRIFCIGLDGTLDQDASFKISKEGLEGIATGSSENVLLAVREDGNELLEIGISEEEITARRALSELDGYDAIAHHFQGSDANKGLEGVALNASSGTVFVLKEGDPGLIIELDPSMKRILNHKHLGAASGFADDDKNSSKIDYSGIQHDEGSRFWIVSDKAKRLFHYDWFANVVIQSAALGYSKDGEYREIDKAEGVAVNSETNRLYVVSDKDAHLYVFDIR